MTDHPDSPDASIDAVPEHLRRYIADNRLDAEILLPNTAMPTVPLAAAAIGVEVDRILKTLVFSTRDGRLVVAIAAGTQRIDRKKLALAAGLPSIKLADPEVVIAATGFPAGGVAPIAHRTVLPVVIDERAAALDVVYGGAGTEFSLVRLSPTDIIHLTGATVAPISTVPE